MEEKAAGRSRETFCLRAHHGMCLQYFRGKGYSSDFTANMWKALHYLQEEDPVIEILADQDHICGRCPNLQDGICESAKKVARYDRGVLEMCRLESGSQMKWSEYRGLVKNLILDPGKREEICGDCSWNELCK